MSISRLTPPVAWSPAPDGTDQVCLAYRVAHTPTTRTAVHTKTRLAAAACLVNPAANRFPRTRLRRLSCLCISTPPHLRSPQSYAGRGGEIPGMDYTARGLGLSLSLILFTSSLNSLPLSSKFLNMS